ncbi:hypothetical protein C8R44DRAFT_977915 [Mycena epipterygia]|nr:hypothetical protein C8R44DRAFT_977915 [Mycena epipterygia]
MSVSREEERERRNITVLGKTVLCQARLTLDSKQLASDATATQEEIRAMAGAAEARGVWKARTAVSEVRAWTAEVMGMAEKAMAMAEAAEAMAESAEAMAESAMGMAESAMGMAEAAEAKAAEVSAEVKKIKEQLALLHKGRVAAIDSELRRLTSSLKAYERVLRYEVLVRIMRGIYWDAKRLLTWKEKLVLKNAKFDWVTHLVEVERYTAWPQVTHIADKLRESLPAAAKELLAFCQDAVHRYGIVRHPLRHPIPSIRYAIEVLSSIALEIQDSEYELDVTFAWEFSAEKALFVADDLDPRRQLEDEIAELEAEKAALLQSVS